ncbi:malyl-CoA thiolesterase [Humibacillus sp. DSM 29435]|uniref:HpcH/HpaI aldolase/citrate lyase family protein n=1 Tax=Humibacillus sp. DSM 29435 TaxID=1869167 RepID=UPI000873205F|nr:CoA ester lyase [Humibacillus sp. DSM 29435]OFE16776.1 malyl-CoA thiolesterase [Humibacillus sp. DSM 29435]
MTTGSTASETFRPRRSVLYLPSSNERALEKAKTLPVDALILDLEDAVAPDAKDVARENACAAARSGTYGGRELTIRVNGIGSPWHEADLAAVAAAGPDAIVVPKVNTAAEVRDLVAAMEAAGAFATTALWAMIETPVAVLHAEQIARASARLTCFVLGTNDLYKELGATYAAGRAAVSTSLQLVLLAARSAGIAVVDGVFNDVTDAEGFRLECQQGRELGFDGKTLIHPGQVQACNEVFAPSAEQVEQSRAVIAAFEAAMAQGRGVATLNGRLIENLHVDTARQVIATAEAIAALE